MSTYQAEIDGLRALAIIPVVLFHAGFDIFAGGYIGVDIFFVISGYLITTIIINDLVNQKFSFIHFFIRRVRRLMPMAITVYLFVLATFFFLYPVSYFADIVKTATSSALFISNIYFWRQGGYFAQDIDLNPLLHTWSLSVEEQFYFLFPVFLVLLFRYIENTFLKIFIILLGIAASITMAVIYAPSPESWAAFYLLPTRMYELAIGSIVAFLLFFYPEQKLRDLKFLKLAGIVLLIAPVFWFDEFTSFPSYNALIPVLGTALVLYCRRDSGLIDKTLAWQPLVYIGLISYSLYLWHWPLFVIRNWIYDEPGVLVTTAFILVSVCLSVISHRYIEKPFRNTQTFSNPAVVKSASASYLLLLVLLPALYLVGNGATVDPEHKIHSKYQEAITSPDSQTLCFNQIRLTNSMQYCEFGEDLDGSDVKRIFVWGDSHGNAMAPALANIGGNYHIRYANSHGCPPVLGIKRTDHNSQCQKINNLVFDHIESEVYDLVLLIGAFHNYVYWGILGVETDEHFMDVAASRNALASRLPETLDLLETDDRKVALFMQPPRFEKRVPQQYLRNATLKRDIEPAQLTMEEYAAQSAAFRTTIPDDHLKNVIDLKDFFCPNDLCRGINSEYLIYRDAHHLSPLFASSLAGPLVENIERILAE